MVITGSLTTVYDDNNVARIRLGFGKWQTLDLK